MYVEIAEEVDCLGVIRSINVASIFRPDSKKRSGMGLQCLSNPA